MIENGELGSLLATAQSDSKKQDFLTWFMKKGQKLGQSIGKLSWINDVVGQGNYARAAKTLANVAEDQEDDLSNQTIEIFPGKAFQSGSSRRQRPIDSKFKRQE